MKIDHIGYESEIGHELIINDIVAAPIRPQHICPLKVNLLDDAYSRLLVVFF